MPVPFRATIDIVVGKTNGPLRSVKLQQAKKQGDILISFHARLDQQLTNLAAQARCDESNPKFEDGFVRRQLY
jgi:hypothetical protein